MPQLPMEMFNRLYKAVTIGEIVNRQQRLPTHGIYSSETLTPNEGVILSPQSISFTCPIVYLSLPVVFYRCLSCFTGFGEMRYREREREEDKVVCLLCRFTASVGPCGRARWPSPWGWHIQTNMLTLTHWNMHKWFKRVWKSNRGIRVVNLDLKGL